jgi:putative oxidoreductase
MVKSLFQPVPLSKLLPQVRGDIACLVLRAGLAAIFIYHGLDKILGAGHQGGANWLSEQLNDPGIEGDRGQSSFLVAVQLAVAWGEILGGAALALGLFTRLAAAGMILFQAAAVYLIYYSPVFSPTKQGSAEYNFALLAMCVALVLLGGGWFSLDYYLFHRAAKQAPEAKTTAEPVAAGLA